MALNKMVAVADNGGGKGAGKKLVQQKRTYTAAPTEGTNKSGGLGGGIGVGRKAAGVSGTVKPAVSAVDNVASRAGSTAKQYANKVTDGVISDINAQLEQQAEDRSGNDRGYYGATGNKRQQSVAVPAVIAGYVGSTAGSAPQSVPILSYEEYLAKMGADDYMEQVKAAIAAQVAQARSAYEAQIAKANEDAEETARQAYVANRLGQKNMDQKLAASGIYGGMADSQRLAAEATYQNNLAEIDRQRTAAIEELRRAITNAEMLGDQQSAEALKEYLSALQSQYSNYWQNAQSRLQQTYGIEGGAGTAGGYGFAGYTATPTREQIQQMQSALGVNPDGVWGPISTNAAGGLSAEEAWQMYQQAYGV